MATKEKHHQQQQPTAPYNVAAFHDCHVSIGGEVQQLLHHRHRIAPKCLAGLGPSTVHVESM